MAHDLERIRQGLSDRYDVERELGSGGMATVFLARDRKHGREVAIKVLRRSLAHTIGVDRFLREIEVIARLQHPHILTLIDSGEIDGLPYYVMPYVRGQSLAEHLAQSGRLGVDEAVRITREIVDALQHAHAHGVIHRDIKPANILMSEGHAVVSDFGIATALEHATVGRMTETGISMGSPVYMSPEQAAGERDLDARTDIYSLGCVIYEMLAGAPPVSDDSIQGVITRKLMGMWPPLREVRPDVPKGVESAVAKAIATQAGDRFAEAGTFAGALAEGMAEAEDAGAARVGRRRLATLAGVAVVTVTILAVGIVRGRAAAERSVWATQQLGRLELLATTAQHTEAFLLAEELKEIIPGDTTLTRLRPEFTDFARVVTDVPGARVYRQMYDKPDEPWEFVGVTPIDSLRIHEWGSAAMRFRFEAEGVEPMTVLAATLHPWFTDTIQYSGYVWRDTLVLRRPDGVDEGMVWIPGYRYPHPFPDGPLIEYQPYWLDRFETTNAQFKEFVDAGGYQNTQYWTEPFIHDGKEIAWGRDAVRRQRRLGHKALQQRGRGGSRGGGKPTEHERVRRLRRGRERA